MTERLIPLNVYMKSFRKSYMTPKRKRVDWKGKYKKERAKVIDEAISNIKQNMRCVPTKWHKGYSSAITVLELMKINKPDTTIKTND